VDKYLSKVKLRQKVAALGCTPLSGCDSTLLGNMTPLMPFFWRLKLDRKD
jgi:hypothetical protein